MKLTGLHLLFTYACTYECDHCFVWGSPNQRGTLTLAGVREILRQANELGGIEWIYFEGGEPFLYYAALRRGVEMASGAGFKVGIVSNCYWATDDEDAVEQLRPFAGRVQDLSLSCDLYHGEAEHNAQVERARRAAEALSIPCDVISVAQPGVTAEDGEYNVHLRGRAAKSLADRIKSHPWRDFDSCPYENLRDPGRVHVDPLGHLHVCQGISIGNLFETPLTDICRDYDPDAHPIVGPLVRGGPAALAEEYDIPHGDEYGDACHFCDAVRRALRSRFSDMLAPDQMYGVVDS
jgi:MoaA/NifB/PqqE/SkfB family radical SAM enzyme